MSSESASEWQLKEIGEVERWAGQLIHPPALDTALGGSLASAALIALSATMVLAVATAAGAGFAGKGNGKGKWHLVPGGEGGVARLPCHLGQGSRAAWGRRGSRKGADRACKARSCMLGQWTCSGYSVWSRVRGTLNVNPLRSWGTNCIDFTGRINTSSFV